MSPPLALEPLEDRMMLSGMNAGLINAFRLDPVGDTERFRLLSTDEAHRPREDMSEPHFRSERELAGHLSNIATSLVEERSSEKGNPASQGSSLREAPLAFSNPLQSGSVARGQPFPPLGPALPEAALTLDLIVSVDGTAELAVPGPFSDSVILDAWQGGLPLPQTELVPVADKDLTIIAAYLVGTPPEFRTAERAASATEFGLTEFIVGHQDSRAERPLSRTTERVADAPTPPPAQEQWQIEPDQVPMVPSSRDVGRAEPDTDVNPPCEEERDAKGESQDLDRDDEG